MGGCLSGPKDDNTNANKLDTAIQNGSPAGNGASPNKKGKKKKSQKKGNPDYPFVPADNIVKSLWSVFTKDKVLGKGASCEVAQVRSKTTNERYAMKIMAQDDKWNPILFKQEVEILQALEHNNIMRYENCYMDRVNFYVALELCGGGELFDKIKDLKRFTEKIASEYITTIVSAIEHCHDKNIVHRDLKPENIVFRTAKQKELVIIDFGDAKAISDEATYEDFVGTAYYLAPECVRDRKGWELKKSDMWTIGVITYVCLTGRPPFYGKNNKAILRKILNGSVQFPKKPKLSNDAKDFIQSLLQKEPSKRLSASDALNHPWLTGAASSTDISADITKLLADYSRSSKLKKVLVKMLAREMTDEDEKELQAQFQQIDTDGNGNIDKKELMKFIQGTGVTQEVAEAQADEMMSMVDADDDGTINYDEFKDARLSSKLTDDKLIKAEFQKIDHDNNGEISKDELAELFNFTLGEDLIKKMIEEIDENDDGVISLEEFSKAMKKGTFASNFSKDKREDRRKLQKIAQSVTSSQNLDKYDQYRKDEGLETAT